MKSNTELKCFAMYSEGGKRVIAGNKTKSTTDNLFSVIYVPETKNAVISHGNIFQEIKDKDQLMFFDIHGGNCFLIKNIFPTEKLF